MPSSVRNEMRVHSSTLKSVARMYDEKSTAPANRVWSFGELLPELQAWAAREANNDRRRIEVHAPNSVTVHNSHAAKLIAQARRG